MSDPCRFDRTGWSGEPDTCYVTLSGGFARNPVDLLTVGVYVFLTIVFEIDFDYHHGCFSIHRKSPGSQRVINMVITRVATGHSFARVDPWFQVSTLSIHCPTWARKSTVLPVHQLHLTLILVRPFLSGVAGAESCSPIHWIPRRHTHKKRVDTPAGRKNSCSELDSWPFGRSVSYTVDGQTKVHIEPLSKVERLKCNGQLLKMQIV